MSSTGVSVIGIFVLLIVLVFLFFLVVGAIFAVVRVGKNHGATAAIGLAVGLLVLPLLGLAAVASIFFVRMNTMEQLVDAQRSEQRAEQRAAIQREAAYAESFTAASTRDGMHSEYSANSPATVARVNAMPNTPPVRWVSATDLGEFQASLYPGILECAAPLAQQVGEMLQQPPFAAEVGEASEGDGIRFLIRTEDDFGDQADPFVGTFMKSLQERFPHAELTQQSVVRDRPIALESDEVRLTLAVQVERIEPALWDSGGQFASGNVACRIGDDSNTARAKLQFAEKPWVTRFDEIVSKVPYRAFVVGYSSELASSEVQARQSALENVRAQVDVENWNGARVKITDEHVVDRFAQRLSRPYGDVWREAVLVDLSGPGMQWTAATAVADAGGRTTMKRLTVLFALLLVLATIVVCFLANVLTQGYYRKPIRQGTVVVIALVVLGGVLFLGLVGA
ncbi:hypothetical protein Q31b_55330 [Novipirellula aureliae]|uniref:Uncharacterized protein n=1 Tax=Novipirellula aureliae TaxID=2527966 RepID=A0A5C6DD12_9BACT|nr:hypothetical protein [Novipirellula aureliae]TWU34578.1 hypothetical protein Q31b_55330 [Novipirellula aureliae]